jgi:hypothetical protein
MIEDFDDSIQLEEMKPFVRDNDTRMFKKLRDVIEVSIKH